ncbi:MotA/TolQ/ExbB proton channel family protein [Actinokineospora sp. UTMC 2448]|uniref:MotA/TolQ/ExbB proton channel family protein n=1 Tax=Actinokineospora sp. UTMC 2448 TaxID=2268449 RepID=UPI002164477D|nr:MotA/TolQ/ExbB proton channel family protein [Actinokineospora sp. UTMC 2448]UVS78556.1 hypothetical protein Actkin_02290 [Actinokineospora sp. UTMC 2448]
MTALPSGPGAHTTTKNVRPFLITGVLAAALTALCAPLGLFDWIPVIGPLVERDGLVSFIATLILAATLWIMLFALARRAAGSMEHRAIAQLRATLREWRAGGDPQHLAGALWTRLRTVRAENSVVGRRISAWATRPGSGPEDAVTALAARSELDHALSEVSFVPARAVVWALPALGFLGTAAEMSRAVGGLGTSVGQTTSYADLRNALVGNVIPPLADAFGVTLFALGASVLCHLVLTWVSAREQRILLDVEEATLELLATGGQRPAPASAATLNGELTMLSRELSMTRTAMTTSASQVAQLDLRGLADLQQLGQLPALLRSVDQRLGQIHAELQRDLVLTRLGSLENRG